MASDIFAALAKQKVNVFLSSFAELAEEVFYDKDEGKLRHTGEFGSYRENICSDFLKTFIPSYLNIGNGFLINNMNEVSTQCDLILYDPQYTPRIEDSDNHRFFPVETVAAIGEVKSKLGKSQLLTALVKLAKAKSLRRKVHSECAIMRRRNSLQEAEIGHHFDFMVSFLICDSLSFKFDHISSEITAAYDKEGIDYLDRHNLVLSLQDGIFCYTNHLLDGDITWMYPSVNGEKMGNMFLSPGENDRNHLNAFTSLIFGLCSSATIYLPHLPDYDTPQVHGSFQVETFTTS